MQTCNLLWLREKLFIDLSFENWTRKLILLNFEIRFCLTLDYRRWFFRVTHSYSGQLILNFSLVIIFRFFAFFFFTSLNFDFFFSLTLYKTWNEHWKLIATMIYIVYKSWKISIIYTIISPSLNATKLFRIEAKNNFVSSESRRDLCTIAWTIQSASILSDTRYDSTFERLP